MMSKLSDLRIPVVGASVVALLVGCASADTASDDSERSASTASAISGFPVPPPPPPPPACPTVKSGQPPQYYQQVATRVAKYILGGPDPMAGAPKTTTCGQARVCVDSIRAGIAQNQVGVTAAEGATVCGLQSSVFALSISSVQDFQTMSACSGLLDDCFGDGVSGFFYASPLHYGFLWIDPEPAVLTADLTGSNGATAAAVYVNSLEPTSVLRWTSSYVAAPSILPGTACATTSLAAGAETLKLIQGIGSYRRCI